MAEHVGACDLEHAVAQLVQESDPCQTPWLILISRAAAQLDDQMPLEAHVIDREWPDFSTTKEAILPQALRRQEPGKDLIGRMKPAGARTRSISENSGEHARNLGAGDIEGR
jgi:hypothetical protein